MTASSKPETTYRCANCNSVLYPDVADREGSQLELDQLPPSIHPWIVVKFAGCLIYANEEWAPYVRTPDGKFQSICDHHPSSEDSFFIQEGVNRLEVWTIDDIIENGYCIDANVPDPCDEE